MSFLRCGEKWPTEPKYFIFPRLQRVIHQVKSAKLAFKFADPADIHNHGKQQRNEFLYS